jgi:hypothetical protein
VEREVVWTYSVWELFGELPKHEREAIPDHLKFLRQFPHMYPVRFKGRRLRRHRWVQAGNWLVYYRVVENTIYIRGIWPARIP